MSPPLLFLSHAGDEAVAAREIARRLRKAGLGVWLDIEELKPGDRWMESLEVAITQADAFAVYVGRAGVAHWVDREVRLALDRNTRDASFRVIPVLGPGADPRSLPPFLRQHQWLDLRAAEAVDLQKLVDVILQQPSVGASLLPPEQPPFRGLLSFDVEHALLFFGRDREVEELLECLADERFLAVVGDSGSGKSSLVRAGLLPALHRGRFHDGASGAEPWRVAIFRPGDDPFREMGNAMPDLDSGLSMAERLDVLDSCRRRLREDTGGLYDCVVALVPRTAQTLLVIDQFEELFTAGCKPEEQRRFVDSLLWATAGVGDHSIHVVITLRADFYSRCWEHPELPKRIARNQYAVRRMDQEHLREAIERPLALAGARLEAGLLDTLLSEVGDEPGNLPLLEHALLQLWERRVGAVLTHDVYKHIGRLSGALNRQADQVLAGLGTEHDVRRLFTRLVRVGRPPETSADTRARVYIDELDPSLQRISEALAAPEARLVVRTRDPSSGRETVELAHEALIRGWRRLDSWLNDDREFLFWRQRLSAAHHDWKERAREAEGLLRGSALNEAERWIEARGSELSDGESRFVLESRSASRRARSRRQALQISAIGAVVAFAATTGVLWRNSETARRQSERTLASADFKEARLLSDKGRPDHALAYLARAARLDATNSAVMSRILTELMSVRRPLPVGAFWHDVAVNVVRLSPIGDRVATAARDNVVRVWALHADSNPLELRGHRDEILTLEFSTDARHLSTFSADGTARLWSLPSGDPVGRPLQLAAARFARFSPGCGRLLTASPDGVARLWNTATGGAVGVPMRHGARLNSAEFSADGHMVVTASEDRTARVWDSESGRPVGEPLRHRRRVWSAEFSPDGTRVVTASADATAQIWEARSGRAISQPLNHGRRAEVWVAHFSPDGRFVMTVTGGTLQLWSAADGALLGKQIKQEGSILVARFSPDGRLILTGSSDGTARLWAAATSTPVCPPLRHSGGVDEVEFGPDGTHVLTASEDRSVRVWDVTSKWMGAQVHPHLGLVTHAEFSPNGRLIATASADRTARVWDVPSGVGGRPLLHGAPVNSVRFDPDSHRVVTSSQDGTAQIWDSWSGRALTKAVQLGANVIDSRFSHDGQLETIVSLLEDGATQHWAAASGQLLRSFKAPSQRAEWIGFSEDRNYVIGLLEDKTAYLRDLRSGQQARELGRSTGRVNGVEKSSDGRLLLTIAEDGGVRVWDQESGEPVGVPLRHVSPIRVARFSAGGRHIFTATGTGEARLWNTMTGQPISQLASQVGWVSAAVFSPDGNRVATASESSTVIWDVNTGLALSWPLTFEIRPRSVSFSPDGQRLLVVSGCAAWLWDVPVGQKEDARLLADLAEAVSGYELAGGSTLVPLRDQTTKLRRLREASLALRGPCPFAWCFIRWLLVDPCCSQVSPLSKQSLATYAKSLEDYGARHGLPCWR